MRSLIFAMLALALAGCAGTMLPGKLYALKDATVLEFQIQTSYGSGSMTATNPKTGEKFTGQYTGIYHGQKSAFTNVSDNRGNSATVTSFSPPTNATAKGVLMGDMGTVIELFMEIQPGIKPRGNGEGVDNHGQRYQVQF